VAVEVRAISYLAVVLSRQRQVTEAARLEAERALQKQAFLADVTGQLTGSCDPELALQLFSELMVPNVCDW
jgi:hypothetical protein